MTKAIKDNYVWRMMKCLAPTNEPFKVGVLNWVVPLPKETGWPFLFFSILELTKSGCSLRFGTIK